MAVGSAVKIGRIFEHSCRQFLQSHLTMQLRLSGGSSDQGVDLRGSWNLEVPRCVLVQCKHYSKAVGPAIIREMEGTAAYYEMDGMHPPLSIICASSGFSQASWRRALSSRFPLLLLHLQARYEHADSKASVKSQQDLACNGVWMNAPFRAATQGHVEVVQRYDMLTKTCKPVIRMCGGRAPL